MSKEGGQAKLREYNLGLRKGWPWTLEFVRKLGVDLRAGPENKSSKKKRAVVLQAIDAIRGDIQDAKIECV